MTTAITKEAAPDSGAAPDRRRQWIERGSLALLLIGALVAYLCNLSANGWANSFYTAAIQAGSESWKAWFFGSSDMANSITVDKPPASLWIPGLSVRVFGLNSWSLLVPQVLMGVFSVWLLYAIIRRWFGHWAGIGAGLVLAVTPVAALMFRFNNPEALLILLMLAAVWATMKGIESGRWRAMILAGVAVGFGFLTKQLQVFLVLPALVVAFFAFAPGTWLRRIGQLFAALGAMIVSAGWWILAVELWPADSRPYIGGSQNNSILELTLGYNGFGRLNGNETGSVVPGGGDGPGGGGSMWGESGFWRMFTAEQGGQIAWLIPAALIFAVAALILIGRAPRTDRRRATLVVFGIWLLTTMVVFSYMQGIFHSYYTAAIAPALAGLIAAAVAVCWAERDKLWVSLVLAAGSWTTAIWAFVLLGRSPDFMPWLRWAVLVCGLLAGAALLIVRRGAAARAVAAAAVIAALAGPVAYTVDTLASPAQGSIVSAGPQVAGGHGPGGGGPGGGRGGPPGMGDGARRGIDGGGMRGGMGAPPAGMGAPPAGMGNPSAGGDFGGGGAGGLLNGSSPSEEILSMLRANADQYTWVAAAMGSNQASGYQIESGYSVMPIGGFNGTDPSPTLAQFKQYVDDGEIHYFIGGGRGGPGGGSSEITEWVEAEFDSVTVDGVTLYDLTDPK